MCAEYYCACPCMKLCGVHHSNSAYTKNLMGALKPGGQHLPRLNLPSALYLLGDFRQIDFGSLGLIPILNDLVLLTSHPTYFVVYKILL